MADTLDNVWTYQSDHTTLVIGLRRDPAGTVRASAMVRLTTVQPLAAAPTLALNALPGRQWEALALTLPGKARLALPSAPVTADLDAAVVPGASGVLLGEFRNAMFLMPISDPAALTRIALRADDDKAVKQFIRRAAAAGEHVAVYDPAGAWTMTSRSPRIWITRDVNARPPHQPTMVVHNGSGDGFPRARTMVRVGDGAVQRGARYPHRAPGRPNHGQDGPFSDHRWFSLVPQRRRLPTLIRCECRSDDRRTPLRRGTIGAWPTTPRRC